MLEEITQLLAGCEKPRMLLARQHAADLDDAVLVSLASAGRTEAHTAIWGRYAPLVRSIVRRTIGPKCEVEDLVQEVFLQFYRTHMQLRDRAALRPFLAGISLRVAIHEIRSRRARKRQWSPDNDGQAPSSRFIPPADFEAREAMAGLRAILDRLDPKDRSAFVLRHVEGLELAEVAGMLDVSVATVKRRLGRIAHRVNAMSKSDQRLVEYLGTSCSYQNLEDRNECRHL